jgi:hypothetical protein
MSKTIILNPEVIAQVLKHNEVDVYILWAISKLVDQNNSGIVPIEEIINIAKIVFQFSSTFVYDKIKKGTDLYWTAPHGKFGKKTVCLFSINKIVNRLKPEVTRSKPVAVPLSALQSQSSKYVKELLISIFAARYEDERPVAIETISFYTGQSESTVRNAIKSCKYISSRQNHEVIDKTLKKTKLSLTNEQVQEYKKLKLIQKNYSYIICKQISNSYRLLEFDRLPLRTRPKALKMIDKNLVLNLEPRHYHEKNGKLYSSRNKAIL